MNGSFIYTVHSIKPFHHVCKDVFNLKNYFCRLQTDTGDGSSDGLSLLPPPTKSVYVQTDYRDSETQTDPYSPEYVIQPGTAPELLTLASLCYGQWLLFVI